MNGFFYYLVTCKCISTTVQGNGTVQFTLFLVMRLNIRELWFAYCSPCNLICSSLKFENGLKKHVRHVARTDMDSSRSRSNNCQANYTHTFLSLWAVTVIGYNCRHYYDNRKQIAMLLVPNPMLQKKILAFSPQIRAPWLQNNFFHWKKQSQKLSHEISCKKGCKFTHKNFTASLY